MERETVIVLDFGGQYNQLIAKVQIMPIYCECIRKSRLSISEMNPEHYLPRQTACIWEEPCFLEKFSTGNSCLESLRFQLWRSAGLQERALPSAIWNQLKESESALSRWRGKTIWDIIPDLRKRRRHFYSRRAYAVLSRGGLNPGEAYACISSGICITVEG